MGEYLSKEKKENPQERLVDFSMGKEYRMPHSYEKRYPFLGKFVEPRMRQNDAEMVKLKIFHVF